ncbi:hypothetical protein [Microbacterium thalli]|uniref:MarR family transcriptional regulator n=1 Tax=Microbacterium thalli TaxID=3027921 RepID=A0ABT5SEE4_9MICO|nr:hypothetical protein [Microbacterium thalli]MDD7961180.1 hypothetical protein [Microbacterium thalli]
MTTEQTTQDAAARHRTLAFWARAAGSALAAELDRALAPEGLDRRDWAVLNVVAGTLDAPTLAERVQQGGKRIRALAARGWVEEADGQWRVSDRGRTERERIQALVDAVHARVSDAVPEADLATTLATLQTIARELGWDESAPRRFGPRGHRGFGAGFGARCGGHHRGEHRGGHRAAGAHHEHDGEHPRHRGERAFERGFTAGFRAGRDAA